MPNDSDAPSAPDAPAASARTEVHLDDAGRVAESLSCRACGYDVKGIDAHGVCPECACAVELSIRGDLLQFCDPAWLDRLALGLLLVFAGIIGGTSLQITIMIAAMIAGMIVTATGGASDALTMVMLIGGLAVAVVTLVNVIGAWLVTTQDPGRTETEARVSARKVARFAIMASLVSAPMQMLMGQTGALTSGGVTGASVVAVLVVSVVTGVGLVALAGWIAFYVYVRQIALRGPLDKLARQLRIIMWGYALSTGFALTFGFVSMLMMATGRFAIAGGNMSPAMQITAAGVGIGSCASTIVFIIFEVWAALVLLALRNRLTVMVARDARPSGS